MDRWAFGLTMMVGGVGGTFLMLSIVIGAIHVVKRVFPVVPPPGGSRPGPG